MPTCITLFLILVLLENSFFVNALPRLPKLPHPGSNNQEELAYFTFWKLRNKRGKSLGEKQIMISDDWSCNNWVKVPNRGSIAWDRTRSPKARKVPPKDGNISRGNCILKYYQKEGCFCQQYGLDCNSIKIEPRSKGVINMPYKVNSVQIFCQS